MKKKKSIEDSPETSRGMFDILNGIQKNQSIDFFDSLTEVELNTYKTSKFIINRFISMTPEYIPIVDVMQTYSTIPERYHYLFYSNILPKKTAYNKYIKNSKQELYNLELQKIIAKYYSISIKEAIEYLDILIQKYPEEIVQICKRYGIEESISSTWLPK